MTRTIIFDLDDTLIKTSEIFNQARKEFYHSVSELGFSREEVLEKLDEIDIRHIHEQGFSKERYPLSLIKTYHYYCKKSGKRTSHEMEKRILNIGQDVFQQKPRPVQGVREVLNYLKNHYQLILATLGDKDIQQKKVHDLGLESYFASVYIMRYKNIEEYQQILENHQLKKEDTWLIGNSVRSDLNPGLKLGLNCILIPATTWKFEEDEPISNQYLQLNSLTELINVL